MKLLPEETVRSFIAIELGSQALQQILSFQKELSETGADMKLVESENMHITLRFLGEIPLSLIEKIGEEFKSLQFDPFEVAIRGTGVFPDMRRINVVWVGIEKGILELIDIHGKIESSLKRLGIRPDDHGFSPHITVARVRSVRNKGKLAEAIISTRNKEFGAFQVDSVKLKKSVLTPKGPIYTTLVEVKALTRNP